VHGLLACLRMQGHFELNWLPSKNTVLVLLPCVLLPMRRIVSTTNSGVMARFDAKQSAPDSDPSRERLLGSPPPELLSPSVELLSDRREWHARAIQKIRFLYKAAGRADH
jgi:hypothetical protein